MKKCMLTLSGLILAAGTCVGQYADDGFNPNAGNTVRAIAIQTNGNILLGGDFITLELVGRPYVGRVLANGHLDTTFNPASAGVGPSASVYAMALQGDGKVLIGGDFTTINGVSHPRVARLNTDGTLDAAYTPNANDRVRALALQPDGKLLVGGDFGNLGGQVRTFLGRLNADGTLDTAFNPTFDASVYAIALQEDGKIVVGGDFTITGGQTNNYIVRLNPDGSPDSTFLQTNGANEIVYALAIQADGKIVVGGGFTTMDAQARIGIARLNANGSLDTAFHTDTDSLNVLALAIQPDGKILAGGAFTKLGGVDRVRIGRLNADGTVDTTFVSPAGALLTVRALAVQADNSVLAGGDFHAIGGQVLNHIGRLYPDGRTDQLFLPEPNAAVYGIAVQTDGNILIGGPFVKVHNDAVLPALPDDRLRIARVHNDDTTDTAFHPDATGGNVYGLAVQSNGLIVAAGHFTTLTGVAHPYLGRLNADGTLDATLNLAPDDLVYTMAMQADGKIIIGGAFDNIGVDARLRIGRFNADGSLDPAFTTGITGNTVYGLAVQPDGKILVGGKFTKLGTEDRLNIGRLNADGTPDTAFNPGAGADDSVYAMAVQTDGKIVVGGIFDNLAGQPRIGIARLNADGSLDAAFNPTLSAGAMIYTITLQADGKILIGGSFSSVGAVPVIRNNIARLNADGSLDTSFDLTDGAGNAVYALTLQMDGKIITGGAFIKIGNEDRHYLARIANTEAALQSLSVSNTGNAVTWLRTGTSPEVWRTTFEQSADGATWIGLGAGTRITNGWQLTGLSLPLNQAIYIRARGYGVGGINTASDSIYESVRLVYIMTPAVDITNITGTVTAAVDTIVCTLAGTNNVNVVGTMQWTNSLGTSGTFAAASAWSVTNVPLSEGTNTLTVSGSNLFGIVASDSVSIVVQWSKPEAADFDGDGKADPAASIGTNLYVWLSLFNYSRMGPLPYAMDGATPISADFDGDRLADPAAYLGADWHAWLSTADYAYSGPYSYGITGALPVAADFDNDGLADPAVYNGIEWTAWLSGSCYAEVGPYAYGIAGVIPAAADFDGDGRADPAVYLDGNWYAWLSGSGYAEVGPYAYGFAGAVPIVADFDGDGIGDLAVSHNRQWYAWTSGMGYVQIGPYDFNLQE